MNDNWYENNLLRYTKKSHNYIISRDLSQREWTKEGGGGGSSCWSASAGTRKANPDTRRPAENDTAWCGGPALPPPPPPSSAGVQATSCTPALAEWVSEAARAL
jgi:hypothetical protein